MAPFQLSALAGAGALRSTAADLLCLLRATLDPARTPLAAELERTQLLRLRVAKHLEVGLGWMIARPGSLARCCGTTASRQVIWPYFVVMNIGSSVPAELKAWGDNPAAWTG